MGYLFDFGISQEDAQTERKALKLLDGDRLLSITSAGDVALNLLALKNIRIKCVDVSENQNHLLKIKFVAIQILDPLDAARFLGYMKATGELREKLFKKIAPLLSEKEKDFWKVNDGAVRNGIISAARFETYISRFNGIALQVVGKKKLLGLFKIDSVEDQKVYFDRNLKTPLLKGLFKIVFHPKLYKGRGIASQGFLNSGEKNISDFFFNRFRSFCCSTIARKNYFLQFSFFNEILFQEALPEFLSEEGTSAIRKISSNLEIETTSIFDVLENCQEKEFNKFHLSNIGDWITKEDFARLIRLIYNKSDYAGKISSRYIHHLHAIPEDIRQQVVPDYLLGEKLIETDRYPFYNIVPFNIKK